MPELELTHESDDEMEVDATGDPDVADDPGTPELTEDTVNDDDTPEMEPESRKRDEPTDPRRSRGFQGTRQEETPRQDRATQ